MKVPASTAAGVSDAEMTVQSSALDGETPSVLQVQPAALAAATGAGRVPGPGRADPGGDLGLRSVQ